jgi:hypothetical protein
MMNGFWKSYNFYSLLIGPAIGLIIWASGVALTQIYLPQVSIEFGAAEFSGGRLLTITTKNPTPRALQLALTINGLRPALLATSGLAEVRIETQPNRNSQVVQIDALQAKSNEIIIIEDEKGSTINDVNILRTSSPRAFVGNGPSDQMAAAVHRPVCDFYLHNFVASCSCIL